jgi:hypothetical protein
MAIIATKGLDTGKLKRESPTTNSWFDAAQVLGREGDEMTGKNFVTASRAKSESFSHGIEKLKHLQAAVKSEPVLRATVLRSRFGNARLLS